MFNVLTCSRRHAPEIGTALCEHPLVSHLSFTGSTQTGKVRPSLSMELQYMYVFIKNVSMFGFVALHIVWLNAFSNFRKNNKHNIMVCNVISMVLKVHQSIR